MTGRMRPTAAVSPSPCAGECRHRERDKRALESQARVCPAAVGRGRHRHHRPTEASGACASTRAGGERYQMARGCVLPGPGADSARRSDRALARPLATPSRPVLRAEDRARRCGVAPYPLQRTESADARATGCSAGWQRYSPRRRRHDRQLRPWQRRWPCASAEAGLQRWPRARPVHATASSPPCMRPGRRQHSRGVARRRLSSAVPGERTQARACEHPRLIELAPRLARERAQAPHHRGRHRADCPNR